LRPDPLIDAWEAAWSGRDPAAFRPVCASTVHYEDPACEAPLHGPGALGTHAERLWTAFSDARMVKTGARLSDGRFLAAPVRIEGTHDGDLDDVPPTHRRVVVHAVFYCELEDGRLGRVRGFFDQVAAGRQLGLLPDRGGIGERALLLLRGFGLRLGREG
jgi:steroid delta-isomerase-like uncharacterized protein